MQTLSKSRTDVLLALVLEDIENAYPCIVNGIHALIFDPTSLLTSLTKKLSTEAWVKLNPNSFGIANL